MYRIDSRDRVAEIDAAPTPSTGAPELLLLADDHAVALRYVTAESDRQSEESEIQVAIVRFDSWAHYLGPPNDEALSGHPLYERGLRCYGMFEVQHSSWIRMMEQRNRVHDRHAPERFAQLRHFIITFHDSTFECVAESVIARTVLEKDADAYWATILKSKR
jgi:hypothetical protein